MYVFRRINDSDIKFKFKTGNEIFDEFAPDGSLQNYIKQDIAKGGHFFTYLLLEVQKSKSELLGLLRFRYSSNNEYLEQLSLCKASTDIKRNIKKYLSLKEYSIIYLSRIGVSEKFHEMRVSQIISNFFEFIIQRKRQDIIIYAKILEDLTSVVGSKYKIIGRNKDKKWGKYFLVSKIMEFNPKTE